MNDVERVAGRVRGAESALLIAGAGLSVEPPASIPSFRGKGGLWTDANARSASNIEYLRASPDEWYQMYYDGYFGVREQAQPNAGHIAVAQLLESGAADNLITMNIDGLELEAGSPSDKVVQIHGHDRALLCEHCRCETDVADWYNSFDIQPVPVCSDDKTVMRPSCLLFGDDMLPDTFEKFKRAEQLLHDSDLLVVLGASLDQEVEYMGRWVLEEDPGPGPDGVIAINPEPFFGEPMLDPGSSIKETTGVFLPKLVQQLNLI